MRKQIRQNKVEEKMNLLPQHGTVYYYEKFFNQEESNHFFDVLKNQIEWRQEPIKIFGRTVMQPRLTAWYGNEGKRYRYSGVEMQPQPWTNELLIIKHRIEEFTQYSFNSVLLNFYRNGNDSMGWHSDDEKELGKNPAISSVSFGAERVFHFKHRNEKHLRKKVLLSNGSLLVMSGSTQHFWHHALPKTTQPIGERINLTFRNIVS